MPLPATHSKGDSELGCFRSYSANGHQTIKHNIYVSKKKHSQSFRSASLYCVLTWRFWRAWVSNFQHCRFTKPLEMRTVLGWVVAPVMFYWPWTIFEWICHMPCARENSQMWTSHLIDNYVRLLFPRICDCFDQHFDSWCHNARLVMTFCCSWRSWRAWIIPTLQLGPFVVATSRRPEDLLGVMVRPRKPIAMCCFSETRNCGENWGETHPSLPGYSPIWSLTGPCPLKLDDGCVLIQSDWWFFVCGRDICRLHLHRNLWHHFLHTRQDIEAVAQCLNVLQGENYHQLVQFESVNRHSRTLKNACTQCCLQAQIDIQFWPILSIWFSLQVFPLTKLYMFFK